MIASKKSSFYKKNHEYEYFGGESDIRIPITAAKDEDFLLLRKRTNFRDICDNIFAINNMHPRIRAELDSTSMAFPMLSALPCVALITAVLPNNLSLQTLEYPDIAFFRFSPPHQNPALFMGYNREIDKTPPEFDLIKAIEEHFTDTSLY